VKKNEEKAKTDSKVGTKKPVAPKAPKKASGAARRRKG
jgi:1,4-alpha-glucan branching enzyme